MPIEPRQHQVSVGGQWLPARPHDAAGQVADAMVTLG